MCHTIRVVVSIAKMRVMTIAEQGMERLHDKVHITLLDKGAEELLEPLGILRMQPTQQQLDLAAQLFIQKSLRIRVAIKAAEPLDVAQCHVCRQIKVLIVLDLQVVQEGHRARREREILLGMRELCVDLLTRHDVNVHEILQDVQGQLTQLE